MNSKNIPGSTILSNEIQDKVFLDIFFNSNKELYLLQNNMHINNSNINKTIFPSKYPVLKIRCQDSNLQKRINFIDLALYFPYDFFIEVPRKVKILYFTSFSTLLIYFDIIDMIQIKYKFENKEIERNLTDDDNKLILLSIPLVEIAESKAIKKTSKLKKISKWIKTKINKSKNHR